MLCMKSLTQERQWIPLKLLPLCPHLEEVAGTRLQLHWYHHLSIKWSIFNNFFFGKHNDLFPPVISIHNHDNSGNFVKIADWYHYLHDCIKYAETKKIKLVYTLQWMGIYKAKTTYITLPNSTTKVKHTIKGQRNKLYNREQIWFPAGTSLFRKMLYDRAADNP